MLQSLRDNLKGTVAVIVIAIFAVPMVLFGVEELFVGGLGGNVVATVGEQDIERTELNRAVELRKRQIMAEQNVDPSSELLEDENLRGPMLESLIRQAALVSAAREGGMAVSEEALWQEVLQQPQFQADGQFSQQQFRRLVGNVGYTPATYLEALAEEVMLSQQNQGVLLSSFVTDQDVQQLVALAQQERSFFTITIPASQAEQTVDVEEGEVQQFYGEHQEQFTVPEQVELNYISMDMQTLAERQDVTEDDVQQQYEQEIATFDAEPQYQVAHILVEEGEDSAQQIEQVSQALADGQAFAEVAQEYSDDLGSKESGGDLGMMIEGVFPPAFEEAVATLEEGEVSDPVQTDAGTHFIKLQQKTVPSVPEFAERQQAIEQRLRQSLAEQEFAGLRDRLDELTYSASDLQAAAEALGLEVQTTEPFARQGGQAAGIGQFPAVREAAFSQEVLEEGHNSRVLELPGNRLVVARLAEHYPERVRPLEEVRDSVRQELIAQKTQSLLEARAEEVTAAIRAGQEPQEVAEQASYTFERQDEVTRSQSAVDRRLLSTAFSMPRPAGDQPVLQTSRDGEGNVVVLGLSNVEAGSVEGMEEPQLNAMKAQLRRMLGDMEANGYAGTVVANADVEQE